MTLWAGITLVASIGVSIPMLVWTIECTAALFRPRRPRNLTASIRPTIDVLIPAHNEAQGIRSALETILPQLGPNDRAIVIADNCTDDTANIARACGAVVIERNDPEHAGKSYALDFGVRFLQMNPALVVLVFDADCTVDPGTVERLALLAFSSGRPVQSNYLLMPSEAGGPDHKLAGLGLIVRNLTRSMGLERLGLPCFLNGSGMAFPADVLQSVRLANGKLAEDKWLTADLALAGHLPLFSEETCVWSRLPERAHAQQSQRTRWIHGHLECMRVQGPRLLWGSLCHRRFALLTLGLDLLIPPLSLLAMLWLSAMTAAIVCGLTGSGWTPAVFNASIAALMAACLMAVIHKFTPHGIPGVISMSTYAFSKLPLYVSYLKRRDDKWVRTDRDPEHPGE